MYTCIIGNMLLFIFKSYHICEMIPTMFVIYLLVEDSDNVDCLHQVHVGCELLSYSLYFHVNLITTMISIYFLTCVIVSQCYQFIRVKLFGFDLVVGPMDCGTDLDFSNL